MAAAGEIRLWKRIREARSIFYQEDMGRLHGEVH